MIAECNPLVSVIIPVYNGANFLAKAIDSALIQTYRNTEIIVVDDGSNDDGATKAIIDSYLPQIRSFTKSNGGVASALNLGIQEASGKFVSWLSHDDQYLPEKIQSQVDVIAQRGLESIVYSGYQLVNSKSKTIGTVDPAELMAPEKLEDPLYPLMRRLIHGCSLLIPREAFSNVGMFNESLVHTQDYALWFDMFPAYGLAYDYNILTLSRVHKNQSSKTVQGHVREGDALWSDFLSKLTVDEMTRMSGSEFEFYREMARLLNLTPYRKAYAKASSLESSAWEKLLEFDPTATIRQQSHFPELVSSQSAARSMLSTHSLKLFIRALCRKGVKETIHYVLNQVSQHIRHRYPRRK